MRDTLAMPAHASERRQLLSLARRVLGASADAEDVVQETFLRWYRLEPRARGEIENPEGWRRRVAGRVALDLIRSARVRRERPIGQWVADADPAAQGLRSEPSSSDRHASLGVDPLTAVQIGDGIGAALLIVLQSMSQAERVAFLLHDVFGLPFDEVARVTGRTVTASRQLATAGRRHARERRAGSATHPQWSRLMRAFALAARTGSVAAIVEWTDAG